MEAADLAPLAFLEGLTPEQRGRLAQRCQKQSFQRGDRIISEGETGDTWYGLLSGWVRVTRQTPTGTVLLGKLGPGRFFGELALLQNAPRNATVEADNDCVCAVLAREDFLSLLDEAPVVASHIREVAASRLKPAPITSS